MICFRSKDTWQLSKNCSRRKTEENTFTFGFTKASQFPHKFYRLESRGETEHAREIQDLIKVQTAARFTILYFFCLGCLRMRSAGIRKPETLQVEKGNVSSGDQDLDCYGKDLILDKGVYEARIHFDRAGLKV